MMKIEKWITYAEADGKEQNNLGGMGGWFQDGHRWKDYLASYKEEAHPMLETLRKSIIENKIQCTGDEHQNGAKAVPLWDNGKVNTYSFLGC